jgi:hypothetical protein
MADPTLAFGCKPTYTLPETLCIVYDEVLHDLLLLPGPELLAEIFYSNFCNLNDML